MTPKTTNQKQKTNHNHKQNKEQNIELRWSNLTKRSPSADHRWL